MNKYIEIWFCIHVSTSVQAYCLSKTVFSITVDTIFRKIEISKKSYEVYFIFIHIFSESFSFFVLGPKLRLVVVRPRRLSKKKTDLFARDSAPPFISFL